MCILSVLYMYKVVKTRINVFSDSLRALKAINISLRIFKIVWARTEILSEP